MKHNWTILAACLFAMAIAMVIFRQDEPQETAPASGVPRHNAAMPETSANIIAQSHSRPTPATTPAMPPSAHATMPATRSQGQPSIIQRNQMLTGQAALGSHHEPQGTASIASLPRHRAAKPDTSANLAQADSQSVPQSVPQSMPATRTQDPLAFTPGYYPQSNQAAPSTSNEPLTRAELEVRAASVERDASHELARLIPLLGLAHDQQQRVFQALASTSQNFVPGMLVDGSAINAPAADPQQTILAELSTAQSDAYLQDVNERDAWWSEYIGNITSQLNTATPAVDGGAATTADANATDATAPVVTPSAAKTAHAISGDE